MENFWSDLGERMKDASEDAERRSKNDLVLLSNIPQMLGFLKDTNQDDLLQLLDRARKIQKRKNPKRPPIKGDFYNCREMLSKDELLILDRVRDFMVREVEPTIRQRCDERRASVARKGFCDGGCRVITSKSRELMGANGTLVSNKVARSLDDSEALYSYEDELLPPKPHTLWRACSGMGGVSCFNEQVTLLSTLKAGSRPVTKPVKA